MGFDLVANNPELEDLAMGAYSWSWMLDAGVGLILGYGSLPGGQFVYEPRTVTVTDEETGETRAFETSPNHNDGFPVTADEAKAMALAAKGLASVERYIAAEFATQSAEEQERRRERRHMDRAVRVPVRDDFIEKVDRFAEWAAKSEGFAIR